MAQARIPLQVRERIESQLRSRICSVCVKAERDGTCSSPPDFPCPLFKNLDAVITVVTSGTSESIGPYAERLKALVCSDCRSDAAGDCGRPDDQICALDTYFPLVVEIVETELAFTS